MPSSFGKHAQQKEQTKAAVKEIQLEQKLEKTYGGKALKMLEKMGGYKLG